MDAAGAIDLVMDAPAIIEAAAPVEIPEPPAPPPVTADASVDVVPVMTPAPRAKHQYHDVPQACAVAGGGGNAGLAVLAALLAVSGTRRRARSSRR
jgi:hypothetical protein